MVAARQRLDLIKIVNEPVGLFPTTLRQELSGFISLHQSDDVIVADLIPVVIGGDGDIRLSFQK